MNKRLLRNLGYFRRTFSTNIKPKVLVDENVMESIEKQLYKPRHHPGILKVKAVSLPDNIAKAIEKIVVGNTVSFRQDYPVKALMANAEVFAEHLRNKVPPMEMEQINDLKQKLYDKVLRKEGNKVLTDANSQQRIKDKVQFLLKKKVYNWSPINYDTQQCLIYLFARSAMEYAVLTRIFKEISVRDPNFKPRSLFDFGSGVGTVSWAANLYWKKYFFEYYNVDISGDMNDLALSILQGGPGHSLQNLKGVFYRQFLPANNTMYDLVVSAYSLLELPSFQSRMETILKLWNKSNKYLVLVENGTNAGFKVLNEVRDFILKIKKESNRGHVFAPCPHDLVCPRFLEDDNAPCNFEINYHEIPLTNNLVTQNARYSYIILKKGNERDPTQDWPRVVRHTLVRSKHSICRMCTAQGNLSEVIFTASKHGKNMYHCARCTNWGDRLPIKLDESNDKKSDN